MPRYFHEQASDTIEDLDTGETYQHRFVFQDVNYWANDGAIETLFAAVQGGAHDGNLMRLKIKNGAIHGARWVRNDEPVPEKRGIALAPPGEEVTTTRPVTSASPKNTPAAPVAATVEWHGHRWGLPKEALKHGAASLLSSTGASRIWLFVTKNGRVLDAGRVPESDPAIAPTAYPWTGEEVPASPELRAELEAARDAVEALSQANLARVNPTPTPILMPVSAKELATSDLFEADADPAEGTILNAPIHFWTPGREGQDLKMELFTLEGVPLERFQVPEGFGSPAKEEMGLNGEIVKRGRFAYWFLVTTPTFVTTRDAKTPFLAEPGTVVFVDERHDLMTVQRYLPRRDATQGWVWASRLKLSPKGKKSFQHVGPRGAKETRFAWRIEVAWKSRVVSDSSLRMLSRVILPSIFVSGELDEMGEIEG